MTVIRTSSAPRVPAVAGVAAARPASVVTARTAAADRWMRIGTSHRGGRGGGTAIRTGPKGVAGPRDDQGVQVRHAVAVRVVGTLRVDCPPRRSGLPALWLPGCSVPAGDQPAKPIAGDDRRRRRGGPCVLSAFRSALATPDLRRKILFTLMIVAVYRVGAMLPSPGVSYPNIQKCIDGCRRPEHLPAAEPVQRRRAAAAVRVRARDHAVHHREHHHPAAAPWSSRGSSSCRRKASPARPS